MTTAEEALNDEHTELLKQLMESGKYAFAFLLPMGDANKAVCDPHCTYPEDPHHSGCLHPTEHVRVGSRLTMDEFQGYIGEMLADMSNHLVWLVDAPGHPPCKTYKPDGQVVLREYVDKVKPREH